MAGKRWISAAMALALIGAGATGVVLTAQDSQALAVVSGYGPGDGLDRYVVAVVPAGAAGLPAVDADLLRAAHADLGSGGRFDLVADATWYVTTASSRRVSLPGAEPVPGSAAVVGPELLAALTAAPGVANAQLIRSGTAVLVATSGRARDLEAVPGVVSVEEGLEATVSAVPPSDPVFASAGWNLENTGGNAQGAENRPTVAGVDVNAPTAWETTKGQGVTIAVVDAGFESTHPELAGAWWTNPDQACGTGDTDGNGYPGDCHGWNFMTNSPDVDARPNGADNSHGVMVSSTAAGRLDNGVGSAGVAPEAKVMPLVVGYGGTVSLDLAIQAIRYAADNGADVINASWGAQTSSLNAVPALSDAIAYAASKNVLFVASAGNSGGLNRDTAYVLPGSLPNENIITVGSHTAADTRSGFSDVGRNSVDLFAPGTLVPVAYPGAQVRLANGTSFSAPMVAGGVALYRSLDRTAPFAEIKRRLLADTVKVPALTALSVSGGRLDLSKVSPAANRGVEYSFRGAGTVVDASDHPTQHPVVRISGAAAAGDYSVVLGILTRADGQVYGVADVDVEVGGTTYRTNDLGEITVPLGRRTSLAPTDVALSTALPLGGYALTAQLVVDGAALSRPYAAPLVVAATAPTSPVVPTTQPGAPVTSSAPGGGPSSGGSPTSRTSTASATRTPAGAPPVTAAPAPSSSAPSGTATVAPTSPSATGSVPASAPSSSSPATSAPAPGKGPSSTAPVTTAPSATSGPATTAPSSPKPSSAPSSSTSAPVPGPPTSPAAAPTRAPDGVDYPSTGSFRVTRVAPRTVSTAGTTQVTVKGTGLDGVRTVNVGGTGAAAVVLAEPGTLVFTAPVRPAGTYGVTLFGAGGATSVLPDALSYVASTPGPSAPATSAPATGAPVPTAPATSAPAPTPPATTPPATTPPPTTAPTTAPSERTVNGLRLVKRTDRDAVAGVWGLSSCGTGCPGLQV